MDAFRAGPLQAAALGILYRKRPVANIASPTTGASAIAHAVTYVVKRIVVNARAYDIGGLNQRMSRRTITVRYGWVSISSNALARRACLGDDERDRDGEDPADKAHDKA